MIVGIVFLPIDGALQSDDARAFVGEVGIAQPTVILHADVEYPADRQIGDAAHRLFDQRRTLVRGTAINQRNAAAGDNKAQIVVQRMIFIGAVIGRADQRIDAIGKLLGHEFEGARREAERQHGQREKESMGN